MRAGEAPEDKRIMRRIITGLLAAAVVALGAAPAQAHPGLHSHYQHLYRHVADRYGARAPGRNIADDGVKTRHGSRRATMHELAVSVRTLKRMLHPVAVVRLLAPGAPLQPPGQIESMRAAPGGVLNAIGQCESGGDYSTDTGNGFYGKYQFTQSTWESVGGTGNPAAASPEVQDALAAKLYAREGSSPWPVCGR